MSGDFITEADLITEPAPPDELGSVRGDWPSAPGDSQGE
jgi:hypothetical protein